MFGATLAEEDGVGRSLMCRSLMCRLLGVAGGIILTMKDWNDRLTSRLPQARNRIIRLGLKPGEGQLNLAMQRETILRMAHEYGTRAGELLVRRFERSRHGVKQAWREHLYVRSMIELRAITRHLRGYACSAIERQHPAAEQGAGTGHAATCVVRLRCTRGPQRRRVELKFLRVPAEYP